MAENKEPELPTEIVLNDQDNFGLWTAWYFTYDRKIRASELVNEPDAITQDMQTLTGAYQALSWIINHQSADG